MVDALFELGLLDEAEALAHGVTPRMEESESMHDLIVTRSVLALIRGVRGEVQDAASLADWALKRSRQLDEPQTLITSILPAAVIRLATADAGGALATLAQLDGAPNVLEFSTYVARLPWAARTALAAGDPALAERLAAPVDPRYPLHEHALVSVDASLAEHRGDHIQAAELYRDAAERWKGFEVPWEQAHALLGLGRCSLALGRAGDAVEALRGAREIFLSLRAVPSVAETDALLEQATALSS